MPWQDGTWNEPPQTDYYDNCGIYVGTDTIDGKRVIVIEAECTALGVTDGRAIAAAILEAAYEVALEQRAKD